MKIELKNFKYAAFASQETNCFSADVWIDGKKAGWAENQGHGGPTNIGPNTLVNALDKHAESLPYVVTGMKDPHDPTKPFTYPQTSETIIDEVVSAFLMERDLTKALKKRVLFTLKDKPGIYETKTMTAVHMTNMLKAIAEGKLKLSREPVDKILNNIPLAEALELYKANAN
ncbi:MAG: hypothetical protein WCP82_05080 [Alphaproteobacteria bacterium]